MGSSGFCKELRLTEVITAPFVEETLPQEIINLVLYQLIDHVDVAISSKSHSSNSSFSQMALVADFAARPHGLGKLQDMQLLEKAMTIAFKGCFLLQDHLLQPAKSIWSHFSACSLPVQQSIASKLTQECRKLLLNSDSRVS